MIGTKETWGFIIALIIVALVLICYYSSKKDG